MKTYIAGHRGMVGGALVKQMTARGDQTLITRTHAELDLTDQAAVNAFMAAEKPDRVILAAAKVDGIHANFCRAFGKTFTQGDLSIRPIFQFDITAFEAGFQ